MATLGFYGAAGEVTGSNHQFIGGGANILIDCGFFQGVKVCDDKNNEPFPYNPAQVDALFVTHAHLDHVGRIPKLFKEGFKGKIYSTPPTREIAKLLLEDTVNVIGREAKTDGHEPLFKEDAVKLALSHWETINYEESLKTGELSLRFRDAGHILGSSMLEIEHNGKRLVYTGDLGNSPAPILRDTAKLDNIEYLITEAVYGDRVHEGRDNRTEILKGIIEDTIARGGTLMIPSFSVDRTQDILLELNNLVESGAIPEIPVFVDSPLAIKVTKVYEANPSYFNKEVQDVIHKGDDIFKFPKLRFTEKTEDSIAINHVPNPKIIIAGSGMMNGGRILNHAVRYLPDPNSTLLLVGYQGVNTLGRALQEGAKVAHIFNEDVPVRAKVLTIEGYSAHKDTDTLLDFVAEAQDSLKQVFIVHAEPGAALFFSQRVRDYLNVKTVVPRFGDVVEIDF